MLSARILFVAPWAEFLAIVAVMWNPIDRALSRYNFTKNGNERVTIESRRVKYNTQYIKDDIKLMKEAVGLRYRTSTDSSVLLVHPRN